jgi:hypothetical protein
MIYDIRSDDNEGNNWTKTNKLKLKTNGDCSLNVINEKPIIAFSPLKNLDTNISVLSVIISNDINGGIWNDPLILDSGNLKQNNSSEKVDKISMNIITNRCYITYRYVNNNHTNIRSILLNITGSKQNIPQIIYANSPLTVAISRIVNKKLIVAVADIRNFFLYYLTRDIR